MITLNDHVELSLTSNSNNRYVGKMYDSKQTYSVDIQTTGKQFEGTAVESSLNITFQINGQLIGKTMNMTMAFSFLGESATQSLVLNKIDNNSNSSQTAEHSKPNTSNNGLKAPSGAQRDANLVGKWQQSETYSSGYGSDSFFGTTVNNIIFLADGGLSDGGSQATMSGSSYYGNTGTSAPQKIPNVIWYTLNSHIFLIATENGQTQTVDLGKYYIENGKILITGNNGKKVLLTKVY